MSWKRTIQSRRILPLRLNGWCNIQSLRQNRRASPTDGLSANISHRSNYSSDLLSTRPSYPSEFRNVSPLWIPSNKSVQKSRNIRGNKVGLWDKARLLSLSDLQDFLQSHPPQYPLRVNGFRPFPFRFRLYYHSPSPFPSHPSLRLPH